MSSSATGSLRPLRITILGINYAPETTGIAPYTTSLAEGLVARGHAVTVVTAHPHYPEWRIRDGYGGWSAREERGGVLLHRVRHYVPAKPLGVRRLVSELTLGLRFLAARWHRPDVLLLVSPALFASAAALVRARLSRRLPTAVWVQDLYSLGMVETGAGGASAASVIRAVESWTLGHASGVAVIHDRFREIAVGGLRVPAQRTEVIRNWSHVPPPPPVDRSAVRRQRGWPSDHTVVLHAGNMGVKQGLENVVEAGRLADRDGAPVRFVLLGDGNQRARLASLAAGLRSVQLLAPLPDAEFGEALASADVLLVNELAGLREMAVPSKLTTYFSTSLPVIAATGEGSVTATEVDASGGGVRVAPGDPRALLDAVLALRADPARARQLGGAGRRYRDAVLAQDAAVDHFERWLAGLADPGPLAPVPDDQAATHRTEAITR